MTNKEKYNIFLYLVSTYIKEFEIVPIYCRYKA